MDTDDVFSSSPLQAFSSSGQLATTRPSRTHAGPSTSRSAPSTSGRKLVTSTTRGESAPSGVSAAASKKANPGRSSRLLDALDSLSASQTQSQPQDSPPPSKRRRTEAASEKAAIAHAKKAAEKAARDAEKSRQKSIKAAQIATKKDWTEANKLKRSKAETIKEMVVDIDAGLTAPASKDDSQSQFAGALHGAGITALEARLTQAGATINTVGTSSARAPSSTRPLSTALGIATPLPDFPTIRLRRKIKARLDVEHRIWVPLASPTVQHEPTAIFVLSAPEVLEHLSRGGDSLAQMIPRVRAQLASSGGVAQSAAFQLFFVVIGLQVHFQKVAQRNDQDYRKAVQQRLARRNDGDEDEAGPSTGAGASAASKRRKPTVQETYAHIDREAAELELLRLTIEHGVYVIHSNALVDAVGSIVDIVGEVSIRPYKMIANSHLPFCTDSVHVRTARTEAEMYGAMLQQIPRVTEPAARAIQARYPSLRRLMEAYDGALAADRRRGVAGGSSGKAPSRVDDLLAECEVLSRKDGQATQRSRRVGPAMSKRIGYVFTQTDPLALL